jgi:hypothetical protein
MLCPVHARGRRPPPTLRRDHHRFHRVLTNISMVRLANYRHLLSLCLQATNGTNMFGDRKHMNRPHIMINCSSWAWGGNAPDICASVQKVGKVQLQVRRITVGCVRPRRGLGISSSKLCVRFTNEAKFEAVLEGGARARARREVEEKVLEGFVALISA